ncbi:MAG: hypothetical protein LC742_09910 [Acidobacteria bacterium]|nr:hypothetical protein [Acidobacteriota bacterium]
MKQKQMPDLYSGYLLASFGATTATELSELLEHDVSHDNDAALVKLPIQPLPPCGELNPVQFAA